MANELVGKVVDVELSDRKESTISGTLVSLEGLGATVARENRGNMVTTFVPMDKVTKIVQSTPIA